MYSVYNQDSPNRRNRRPPSSPMRQNQHRNNFGAYKQYISKNQDNFVHSAAPFPLLPSYQAVQELENVVKGELKRYQIELCNKQRQLYTNNNNCFIDQKTINTLNPHSLGIITYRSLFINHNLIDSIVQENHSKIKKSCERASVKTINNMVSESTFYFRISILCRKLLDSTPYMFTIIFKRMQLQQEKLHLLTMKYIELRDIWKQLCNYVDCLNIRTHKKLGEWGIEQILSPTAYDEGGQAPDVIMHLDHSFQSIMIYDMNRFVKNPEFEHNQFKKRIVWLPFEEKTFYEKFYLYPKKFSKISSFLPDKTTKDAIEFYYTHKYTAEMKQVITRLKHRGKVINNKVASEGKVKK